MIMIICYDLMAEIPVIIEIIICYNRFKPLSVMIICYELITED